MVSSQFAADADDSGRDCRNIGRLLSAMGRIFERFGHVHFISGRHFNAYAQNVDLAFDHFFANFRSGTTRRQGKFRYFSVSMCETECVGPIPRRDFGPRFVDPVPESENPHRLREGRQIFVQF